MSVRYSDGAEESKWGDSAKAEVQQEMARQTQSRIENKRWNFIVNQTSIYILNLHLYTENMRTQYYRQHLQTEEI